MTETATGPRVDAQALRRDIHRALADAGIDTPTRPATTKLTEDQADLVVDLLAGFDDRREVLEWAQELVIQSLGQLQDSWFPETIVNPLTVSVLLEEPYGPVEEISPEVAVEIRRGMVANDLLPAFHAAHRLFRWAAVERTDHLDDHGDGDDPDPIDPSAQAFPAMRPAFGELHGQQQEALDALLEGFGSEERLLLWTLQLVGSSYAEISREDAVAPYFEREIRSHLLEPTDLEDRFIRESWAAEFLLPAFNRAANELAQRASEVTNTGAPETAPASGGSVT